MAKQKLSAAQERELRKLSNREVFVRGSLERTYKKLVDGGMARVAGFLLYAITDAGRAYLAKLDTTLDAGQPVAAAEEVETTIDLADPAFVRDLQAAHKAQTTKAPECKRCRSTGKNEHIELNHWKQTEIVCPDCGGTGIVLDYPRVLTHESYQALRKALLNASIGCDSAFKRGRIDSAIEALGRRYDAGQATYVAKALAMEEPPVADDDTEPMALPAVIDDAVFETVHSEYQSRRAVLNRGAKVVIGQSGVFIWRARRGGMNSQTGMWRYYPTYDESTHVDKFVQRYPSQFENVPAVMDWNGQTVTATASNMFNFVGAIMRVLPAVANNEVKAA